MKVSPDDLKTVMDTLTSNTLSAYQVSVSTIIHTCNY